ncbi:MAG: MFS transporter [Actinomycetota bacterium]|nr:MFS transporter [Actinomycetota bacterium]
MSRPGGLTALPTLCFAAFGSAAPRLAARLSVERVVAAAFLLVGAGILVRAAAAGPGLFLTGSLVTLAGVAAANVLGPPLVRRWFPGRAGAVTGLYAMSISAGMALPAAVSVPIAAAAGDAGWRAGIAVWAPIAVLAALPWLWPSVRRGVAVGDGPSAATAAPAGPGRVTTVALTAFFGLQSLGAFVVMGWLPAIVVDAGVPGSTAGLLLGSTAAVAMPLVLAVPVLADRPLARPVLVVAISAAGLAAWTGLLLDPGGPYWLWAVLLASAHCAYPLAIALVRVHSIGAAAELRLSGIVQTGGYTLAVAGPLATGVLRDATSGWTVPVAVVLALLVAQAVAGLVAARPVPPAGYDSGGSPRSTGRLSATR